MTRTTRPMPVVADLRPCQPVDDELDWFFNRAEADMAPPSNFHALLGRPGGSVRTLEGAAEASHRYRRVRVCLKTIADSDAGVLQAAYELRPWPVALHDRLGRLTGVVVRLACALDTWPEDREAQQVVEMARAGWLVTSPQARPGERLFVTLCREAEVRFAQAHQAYRLVRGAAQGAS